MKNTKSVLQLALAVLTALMSAFLPLASVHTYCENRAGAGVLLAAAIAISCVRVRGSVKGPIPHALAILTYLACTLAVTFNVLFIVHASKLCRDYFRWLWLPVILVSYGWLLLWAWLKWRGQSPRFPALLLRSRAVFLGLLLKTLWQRLVERPRRIKAELEQLELELAQENALKPPPQLFPKRPYKASTITLFCVFGFFVAFAAWVSFRELVIPFVR